MSPMILSDKVAGIIKDLTVKNQVQKLVNDEAMKRVAELLDEIAQLKEQHKA